MSTNPPRKVAMNSRKLNVFKTAALFSLLLISLAGLSKAEVIFSDDFTDGNRDGWYLYAKNENSSLEVNNGTLELHSSANTADVTENNFAAVRPFAAVDMTVLGTTVVLQLDYLTLKDQVLNRGIAFGLYDSHGTALTSDTSSGEVGDDDSGYFTLVRRNEFMHRLYEVNNKGILETVAAANRANDDTDGLRVGGMAGSGAHIGGVTPGDWFTYKLEIEAVAGSGDGEVDHLVTVTFLQGENVLSTMTYKDGGRLVENIDQVSVLSMAGNDIAIDNVSVTVTR